MRPHASIPYRPEIDGLRAVAVVPVILFHAGFNFFSGGFVGVDVFFVISGYLITAIIISELEKNDFSLVRFYERRARRILPALFAVMVCCIPFAWLWMEPDQYRAFVKSLAAMALFGSNFFFWWETDYFAAEADEKPLLHTWSLSVEEQFYLLFPLLLLLLWRFGRNRLLLIISVFAAMSLALSEFAWRYSPAANFYLPPTRAWELYAGAICAFVMFEKRPLVSGQATNNLLSLAGLAMIVTPVMFFSEQTPIPSLYALIPVGGTCLIILFANPSTWTARILATPIFVGIGLISYSAYLWHQPLFSFARIRLLSEPSNAFMLALAMLSFGLAYCTWRLVERPFRIGRTTPLVTRKQMFGLAAAASCVLIAVAFTSNKKFYFSRLPSKAIYYAKFMNYAKDPKRQEYWGGRCNVKDTSQVIGPNCLHIEKNKRNYLLIGDSHAAHLSRALRDSFPDDNILQATSPGCRPFIRPTGRIWCDKLYGYIFRDFIPNHKIDGVILSARWEKDHRGDLEATLEWLSKHASRVVVIGSTMIYKNRLPKILRDYERVGEDVTAETISRHIDPTQFDINEIIHDTARKYGVDYVDILAVLCPNKKCRAISATGEPMSYDRAHLTLSGSRTLMDMLLQSGAFRLEPLAAKRPSQVTP